MTDLAARRVFVPASSDGTAQRTLALAALGHVVLGHQTPADYAEFLAQRVEVNYFAAAVLVPQRSAVGFLQEAKAAKDIEIEDLRDRYLVSDEMAAHRFTNLATTHLDIGVHFMKINRAGVVLKAPPTTGSSCPATRPARSRASGCAATGQPARSSTAPTGRSPTSSTPTPRPGRSGARPWLNRATTTTTRSR